MRVRALYPFFQALLKYSERFKEGSGFIACGRGGGWKGGGGPGLCNILTDAPHRYLVGSKLSIVSTFILCW